MGRRTERKAPDWNFTSLVWFSGIALEKTTQLLRNSIVCTLKRYVEMNVPNNVNFLKSFQ